MNSVQPEVNQSEEVKVYLGILGRWSPQRKRLAVARLTVEEGC